MNMQDNLRIVQEIYGAFEKGDIQTIMSLLDERIDWRVDGPPIIPHSGVRKGHSEVTQFFASLGENLDIFQFAPTKFISESGSIVVLGNEKVRVKSTGRTYDASWAHLFILENGKITKFHEFTDTAAIARAFEGE